MVSATQAQQQLMEAGVVGRVGVESGTGVEMMVMDSLDPNLLQMKTEVTLMFVMIAAQFGLWSRTQAGSKCFICALLLVANNSIRVNFQVIDAAVGGSSVGVVGGVAGAAHQATVTTVDQTQIITLQVGYVFTSQHPWMFFLCVLFGLYIHLLDESSESTFSLWTGGKYGGAGSSGPRRAPACPGACVCLHCWGPAAGHLCRHYCYAKGWWPSHLPYSAPARRLSGRAVKKSDCY